MTATRARVATRGARPTRRTIWIAVGAVVVSLGLFQGTAMAKMVIWSAMTGRVLMNGQPVAGATIKREFNWGWKDENGSDQATTGAAGEFSLPAIERSSLLGSIVPHEPVIRQVMTVTWQGRSYDAWAYFKRDYDKDGENAGRPIVVTCRLEAERAKHGAVMGLCEFN